VKNFKIYPMIIFGVSLLLGFVFFIFKLHYQQQHDALNFIVHAKDFITGGIWKMGVGKEPGFPILISPLFWLLSEANAIMLSRVVNIILFSLSSIVFLLTLRILMPRASAKRVFIFSLPFALSPQLASFSSLRVYSEPLQLLLNTIILFCLVKISLNEEDPWGQRELKLWIFTGLTTGCLIMTKSFFLIYPLWIVFFMIIYRLFFYKKCCSIKAIAKPVIIFLCLSYFMPLLYSGKNYKQYGYFMMTVRGGETLLCHTYVVDWGFKDSLKWGVFQLSENLGIFCFPNDAERMAKISGEPYLKASKFMRGSSKDFSGSQISTLMEWRRLVIKHPFRYVWFYFLNSLNHLLFEGVYPSIYVTDTKVGRYIYLVSAITLHFIYSVFIWLIIIAGIIKYAGKYGIRLFQHLKLKYAIIAISLAYCISLSYHFHTEIRYFHPFYVNVYLLFALSCDYLIRSYKERRLKAGN